MTLLLYGPLAPLVCLPGLDHSSLPSYGRRTLIPFRNFPTFVPPSPSRSTPATLRLCPCVIHASGGLLLIRRGIPTLSERHVDHEAH